MATSTIGMIPPSRFIAIAEETGLIVAMEEWVLQQACVHWATWAALGHELSIAVNLSARQFLQGNIADSVAKILVRNEGKPGLFGIRNYGKHDYA